MLITRTSILHYMARFGYFLCSVTAWKHVRTADHWHPGSVLTPNKKSALSATDYTFILSEAVVASAQRSKWWSMSICWHGYRRLGQRSSHIPSTLFFLQNLCLLWKLRTRQYRQVEPTVTWSAPRAQAGMNAQDAALKSPCQLFELQRCELASLATSSELQTSEALLLAVVQRHSDRNWLGVSSRQAGRRTDRQTCTPVYCISNRGVFFFKSGISVVLFLSVSHFLYLPLSPAPFQQSAFQQFFTVSLSRSFSHSDPFVSCCWQILAETWSLGAALTGHSHTHSSFLPGSGCKRGTEMHLRAY